MNNLPLSCRFVVERVPPMTAFLLLMCTFVCRGQLTPFPTGANRAEVSWNQITTSHFTIIYHDGLEADAREAATIAESVHAVVTSNLLTEFNDRTLIYLSDLDDVPNAVAVGDWFIYIWMRGILADGHIGGIRAAGRAKWLRAVITHEFTHTVIARATRTWLNIFSPVVPGVPRWFNEGTARFMEPDGWTSDVDMALRVAAVNGDLGYGAVGSGRLDGTLLYETGHSLVRYMTERFGDSVLGRIVNSGGTLTGYDFNLAVVRATGQSMGDIYDDWVRTVTVLYGVEYAPKVEMAELGNPVVSRFDYVAGIRYSPDGRRIAILAGDGGGAAKLYLIENDSTGRSTILSDESGFDAHFSWSPDGGRLAVAKMRHGAYGAFVTDLYLLDVASGSLRRLTDNAGLSDPAWSPSGEKIVAVEKRAGRDNLVLVDPTDGSRSPLTNFREDVQIYTPSWSPDGSTVAASFFDADGGRRIGLVSIADGSVRRVTSDSGNNRYPIWSPDGRRIAFTSHAGGTPNIHVMGIDGGDRHAVTNVAGGVYSVQWKPGSDSIVVISLDSRDEVLPRLVAASARPIPEAASPARERYAGWRNAAPARVIPDRAVMPVSDSLATEGYSSLAHIRPVIPVVPFWTGDPPANGRGGSIRPALGTAWFDPMGKHLVSAYVDYGLSTRELGGEVFYTNNMLPFSTTLVGTYHPGDKMLYDDPYYEQVRGVNLRLEYLIHAPNSLDINHQFLVGAKYRNLTPLNPDEFASPTVDGVAAPQPLGGDLVELSVGYRYSSSTLLINTRYTRSESALGSMLDFGRLSTQTIFRYPLFGSIAMVGTIECGAHWGDQLPQEFLGLDRYGQFENGLGLDDFISPKLHYQVRGVRRYKFGDRVAVAGIGLSSRSPILEAMFPLFRLVPVETHLFAETGTAWYARDRSLFTTRFVSGYGLELRANYLPDLWLSIGLAFEMKASAKRDIFLRVDYGL